MRSSALVKKVGKGGSLTARDKKVFLNLVREEVGRALAERFLIQLAGPIPKNFAEELGAERLQMTRRPPGWSWRLKPMFWRSWWQDRARKYGLTYVEVKAAYLKLWAELGRA